MPEIPDVVPGEDVDATWGNQIRDRTNMRYASLANLEASEPGAPAGALRWTDDVGLVVRVAGVWQPVALEDFVDAQIAAAIAATPRWELFRTASSSNSGGPSGVGEFQTAFYDLGDPGPVEIYMKVVSTFSAVDTAAGALATHKINTNIGAGASQRSNVFQTNSSLSRPSSTMNKSHGGTASGTCTAEVRLQNNVGTSLSLIGLGNNTVELWRLST